MAIHPKSPAFVPWWLACAGMLIGSGCNRSISTPRRLHVFAETPVAVMATPTNVDPSFDWKTQIGDLIAPPSGLNALLNVTDQVYTVTVPRGDLDVKIDGMSVPASAGLASTFHFYRCTCGKMSVLGEFIVIDYEANDVIDALRLGAIIRITAVSPIAIGDKPHLLSVRFHGEGEATPLAKLVKEAMRWTGEGRMKAVPQN